MKRWHWCAVGAVATLLSGADAQTVDGAAAQEAPAIDADTVVAPPPRVGPRARARLLAFDSPSRIDGAYWIQFKPESDLAQFTEAERYAFEVLPGMVPESLEQVELLEVFSYFSDSRRVDGLRA